MATPEINSNPRALEPLLTPTEETSTQLTMNLYPLRATRQAGGEEAVEMPADPGEAVAVVAEAAGAVEAIIPMLIEKVKWYVMEHNQTLEIVRLSA